MKKIIVLLAILLFGHIVHANVGRAVDIAFEELAYRLELVRNQMELTIANRRSAANDRSRQEREIQAVALFTRIPLVKQDLPERELLERLRQDFLARGDLRVAELRYASGWKGAARHLPTAIAIDDSYQIPEAQLADVREIEMELDFSPKSAPADCARWLFARQKEWRRLVALPPSRGCFSRGRKFHARALIFRFREIEYPRILAPDLSRYALPGQPASAAQLASAHRIARYKKEIVELWARVQPELEAARRFALADQRMSFFLKHASLRQ